MKIFFSFICCLFLFSTVLHAHNMTPNSNYRMKFVFPFGENNVQSVCPLQFRTLDGCCDGPQDHLYTLNQRIGCCRLPNEFLTVGATSACCPALPSDQNRWGQTETSVCGGYCPPASSVYSFSGITSCCNSCSEVIAFQSKGNVCGTCCSRVPVSCGNIGERVCEPGTGSAYCSLDPTKPCSGDGYYVVGSSGEGGYSCAYLPDPCPPKGQWNAGEKSWYCENCYRNGSLLHAGSCAYNGPSANANCTAGATCYSCYNSVTTGTKCVRTTCMWGLHNGVWEWCYVKATSVKDGVCAATGGFTQDFYGTVPGDERFVYSGQPAACYWQYWTFSAMNATCTGRSVAKEYMPKIVCHPPEDYTNKASVCIGKYGADCGYNSFSYYECANSTGPISQCWRNGKFYKSSSCRYVGACGNTGCTSSADAYMCETKY